MCTKTLEGLILNYDSFLENNMMKPDFRQTASYIYDICNQTFNAKLKSIFLEKKKSQCKVNITLEEYDDLTSEYYQVQSTIQLTENLFVFIFIPLTRLMPYPLFSSALTTSWIAS